MLGKIRLFEIIDTCASFSPSLVRHSIEATKNSIVMLNDPEINNGDGVAFLREVCKQFRFIISPAHYSILERTEIVVPPLPICNAMSDPIERRIIIFDGLIEAIAYRLETSLVVNAVRKQLPLLIEKGELSEQDFKLHAFRATLMPIHFMMNRNPLQRFTHELDEKLRRDAYIGLCGMLLFIIFHEIGHLELGHGINMRDGRAEPIPTLAYLEPLNILKSHEFAADLYAYDAIVQEGKCVFIVNAVLALQIFSDFESMSGIFKNSHPLTINRIHRMKSLPGAADDPAIRIHIGKLFRQLESSIDVQFAGKHPNESLLPPDTVFSIIDNAFRKVIGDEDQSKASIERLILAYRAVKQA